MRRWGRLPGALLLASCLAAAFYAMLVWVEAPTPRRGVVFGFCTALALLSKFTALGFLPAGLVGAIAAGSDFLLRLRPSLCSDIHVMGQKVS